MTTANRAQRRPTDRARRGCVAQLRREGDDETASLVESKAAAPVPLRELTAREQETVNERRRLARELLNGPFGANTLAQAAQHLDASVLEFAHLLALRAGHRLAALDGGVLFVQPEPVVEPLAVEGETS